MIDKYPSGLCVVTKCKSGFKKVLLQYFIYICTGCHRPLPTSAHCSVDAGCGVAKDSIF